MLNNRSGEKNRRALMVIVAIILLMIIIKFLFFSGSSKSGSVSLDTETRERIARMEQKIDGLGNIDDRVANLEANEKIIETLIRRVERLEASLSGKARRLEEGTSQLRDSISKPAPTTSNNSSVQPRRTTQAPPSSSTKSRNKYHQVVSGETLFQISRHYDLSVNELRRLNKLEAGAIIRPGQKLKVVP